MFYNVIIIILRYGILFETISISSRLCYANLIIKWRKKALFHAGKTVACPVEITLSLIGDKWKVLILRDLMEGTRRFGQLKKSIGSITQKVLTANLLDMEESGLLTRKVYAEVPPRVEYTLTESGYSLKPILDAMVSWGQQYRHNLE